MTVLFSLKMEWLFHCVVSIKQLSNTLRKGLFTVGAMDNIDHNPSSTTADSSFHGTGIRFIQFTNANSTGTAIEPVSTTAMKGRILPQSYTVVPPVALNQSRAAVMERICENISGNLVHGMLQEIKWLNNSLDLLQSDWESNKPMTSASFHASFQFPVMTPPAITALLPLFNEKADTPAMIKHAMDILRKATSFLNPGQIPVMACDCPIFANAKFIQ